jgi:anti-sigma28 factor (negative regulator of flagellin synthesis)
MDVSGMGAAHGSSPVRATNPTAPSAPTTGVSNNPVNTTDAAAITSPQDEVEISAAGKMLERLSETPEARIERLAKIKEAIDKGDYDTVALIWVTSKVLRFVTRQPGFRTGSVGKNQNWVAGAGRAKRRKYRGFDKARRPRPPLISS